MLRRDIKAMGDNDFTRFVMKHFDEITNAIESGDDDA